MLEGSLIIEGAAWRVRALRLMELDIVIDRFSTVLRTTRRARRGDVLAYFSSLDLKPRATCTSNSRSAGPDPELSLRYGPRPERSTGHGGRRGDRPVGSPFSAHAALNRLCTCVSTTAPGGATASSRQPPRAYASHHIRVERHRQNRNRSSHLSAL